MINKVVVTDAWLMQEEHCYLNPAIKPYEKRLLRMTQQWQPCANHVPLSWYAEQVAAVEPSSLLASLSADDLSSFQQFWVASPYHVRLVRSTLRLMPDTMLAWSQHEVAQLTAIINPLLADYGMQLFAIDQAMVLACDKTWDVAPENFAEISGGLMTNTMPQGQNAGDWMRMLSEVQMLLHQTPIINAEGVQIHGLWFWGESSGLTDIAADAWPAVATRNGYLQVVSNRLGKAQDAELVVTDSGHLPLLLNEKKALPADWLLLGSGKSVKLRKNMVHAGIAKIRPNSWRGI